VAPDRYRFVLGGPVVMVPGKAGATTAARPHCWPGSLPKARAKLHAFTRDALFDPLGIGPTEWLTDRDGEALAASGLRMTPRDLARIGLMMLKGGMWEDRRVVPAQWIERSTSSIVDVDEIRSYGYQWYLGKFAFPFRRGRGGIGRGSSVSGARLAMATSGCLYCPALIWS
jgi:CubicO group peptidase (beta-lactamase class C family)